jgi:hypothetical protein
LRSWKLRRLDGRSDEHAWLRPLGLPAEGPATAFGAGGSEAGDGGAPELGEGRLKRRLYQPSTESTNNRNDGAHPTQFIRAKPRQSSPTSW